MVSVSISIQKLNMQAQAWYFQIYTNFDTIIIESIIMVSKFVPGYFPKKYLLPG
jgi:hypothetical protein